MSGDLLRRSAVELAAMVAAREVSPVELTEAALTRIDGLQSRLNAFATVDHEGALVAARAAADRAGADDAPPFLGVPTAVKDLHLTAGLRTTFGTASMRAFVPDFDEENVARLRRAGFVFVGKSNVPEFGTVPTTESALLGPARNPWDVERSAGGSSGGAAVAVAAGCVPVAHGSDGGGSVRIPASACGVFGLKPSRGRVSAAPLFGEQIGGLSTVGVLSRHVVDAAAMLDVMEGYVVGDPNWPPPPARPFADEVGRDPGRLRIGLVRSTSLHTFTPDVRRVADEAAALFERLGHTVEDLDVPVDRTLIDEFTVLWTVRVAALPVDPATLEPFNRDLYETGAGHTGARVVQALNAVHLHARSFVRRAADYDVVACPTLTCPPLRIGEHAEAPTQQAYAAHVDYVGITPLANMTGQPAASLPVGFSDDGLPVDVQVIGPPAGEAVLLRLAGQVERATGWPERRPPLG